MADFIFYSVMTDYYSVVCKIIEKLYQANQKCLLLCSSGAVALFDSKLWGFSKLSFIPHGSRDSMDLEDAPFCHTWISDELEFCNNPECLVTCGIETDCSKFKKVIDVFPNDSIALAEERIKNYGAINYVMWEQSQTGWKDHHNAQ